MAGVLRFVRLRGVVGVVEPVVPTVARFGDLGVGEGDGFGVRRLAVDVGREATVAGFAEEVAGVEAGFGSVPPRAVGRVSSRSGCAVSRESSASDNDS